MRAPDVATPALFARYASGGKWRAARHLMELDRAVVDCLDGRDEARIIVVEMPPRHGKSVYCSQWLPAWFVCTHRDRKVLLASYSADLSRTFGRAARDYLEQHGHTFGVRVRQDVKSASSWQIAGHDGGMITAGVGGPLTGFGAHLAIVDDPIKNAEEALSDRIREKQIDWFKSTLYSRIEPGGVLLVIQTRWHKEDLAGWIISNARDELQVPVKRLSFPAIAVDDGEPDALGREPGEALWPQRWPVSELEIKRRMNQGYWWEALYQQRPGVYGNSEWPTEYFGDHIWADEWPDRFEASVVAVDPSKGKDNKRGDYAAIVFLGLARGKLYARASIERRPVEKIVVDTLRLSEALAANRIGIEANQFQDLLAPELQRVGQELGVIVPDLSLFHNTVNKDIRISRLGAPLYQQQLRIYRDAGGELLVRQMKDWPFGDHDDGPDALEMAYRLLREEIASTDSHSTEEDRWLVM
jgi:predicted phage terminase large subunit-like protein